MHPDWQKEVYERMVHAPPAFVLDSDRSFDPQELAEKTGLRYEPVKAFDCGFTLFALGRMQERISCSDFAHPSPRAGVPVHSHLMS